MTAVVRRLVEEDSSLVVWWGTRTECLSALARRRREGSLPSATERLARDVLAELSRAWSEILPNEALRSRAERLLAVHPLRAADAFQLASALLWSQGETRDQGLVSFDDRLREAAQREGFLVLPE
jgi:hypothetical protein